MGRIFNHFGRLRFRNEAEVSQNFLIPLLTEFLEYRENEILPEYLVPAFEIPLNRERSVSTDLLPAKAKPDYVVTINGQEKVLVCDSKGPNESLDDYLHQLIAYCIALRTNLLLTTNGTEVRVYNANTLVFESENVEELDLSFPQLYKLLNRTDAAEYTDVERIQTLDLPLSLNKDSETLREERRHRVAIALSDFAQYIKEVAQTAATLELPIPIRSAFETDLRRFPAEKLYSFQEYHSEGLSLTSSKSLSYRTILHEIPGTPLLLIGESGIGKTSLLQQLLSDHAQLCLEYNSDVVPVLVRLGRYTRSQSVLELISQALVSRGANIPPSQIPSLLRNGRFTLLFDAFDEVFDSSVPDLEREIQSLIDDYRNCRLVITTRHFRLPRITPIRRYELQLLLSEQVEAFAQMYLGSSHGAFLEEVTRKGLAKLASNTLLLTLLILLYMREGELPRSRGQILQAIVDRVRHWDETKGERFASPLSWDTRAESLTQLAFSSLSSGKSYALDKQSVEATLSEVLNKLERRRQVPTGLTLGQVLDSLSATGFILQVDEGTVFWHRAFAEHFAATEIGRRFESEPEFVEDLIKKPEWEEVLPLSAAKASDPLSFTEKILAHNVFTAARALIECNTSGGEVYRRVVDALSKRCSTHTHPIRQIAINLLRQLEGSYADSAFYNLLSSEFVDVQKVALVEIARRKTPDARELVFSRLDWDVPAPIWQEGRSGNAVIEALGELDDAESRLFIVSIWRQKPDMFTDLSCRNALLRIARRNKISDKVKQALLDFFLANDKDVLHGHKLSGLAEVLIALDDPDLAPRLISALIQLQGENVMRPYYFVQVLSSFDEPEVIHQLIESANDQDLSDVSRARFAEALSMSAGVVPLHVFEALARDKNDEVRSHGIRGLGRFPFEQIRAIVLRAVHPPPLEQSIDSGYSFAHVQAAAFEVLAQHGKLELLLQEENQPEYFYNNSLEVLFDAVSNFSFR
jgi:hypothetical protein